MKGLFLDRDGIVIRERGDYNYKPEHLNFCDGIFEFCTNYQNSGYKIIIITNQGGIAKDLYSHEEVAQMHDIIISEFKRRGIAIEGILYCPHHNIKGKCLCRKPGGLMIERAMFLYNIDPEGSFMVGDKESDKFAGENAGIKGFHVPSNIDLNRVKEISRFSAI